MRNAWFAGVLEGFPGLAILRSLAIRYATKRQDYASPPKAGVTVPGAPGATPAGGPAGPPGGGPRQPPASF